MSNDHGKTQFHIELATPGMSPPKKPMAIRETLKP
jgi:hypothetical protein